MITDAPVAVAASAEGMFSKVKAFIAAAQSASADGLTWGEFGELLLALLRIVIASLDEASQLTGAQKKTIALDAVAMLFDAVADYAVPAVLLPVWLVARPAIRSLVLALAGGAIEQLLPLVRIAR
jgi:hypothetical protein